MIMKKALFTFIPFLLLLILVKNTAYALEKKSGDYYTEFLQNYRQYENNTTDFNIKKDRFFSYNSVSSQAEYLDAAKNLVSNEILAIEPYTLFVKTLLGEATQVLIYRDSYLYIKLDDEAMFIKALKEKSSKVSSLTGVQEFLKDLSSHYTNITALTYQVKGAIEIGSQNKILENLKVEEDKISDYLSVLTIDSSRIKAAKEKLFLLSKQRAELTTSVASAGTLLKSVKSEDAKSAAEKIRKITDENVIKLNSLIGGYDNVVQSLK